MPSAQRPPGPRPTGGAGPAVGQRPLMLRVPSLPLADDLPTGTARTQDLTQERPEGQIQRIKPLTAVASPGGLGQKLRRQPRAENLTQPTQRGLAPLFGLGAQLIELGAALTPKGRMEYRVETASC